MLFIIAKRIWSKALSLLLFPAMLFAAESPLDESWPDDDLEERIRQVNEGQLAFITPVQDRPVLHSDTHLWVSDDSRQSGWVKMQQCYRHLDAVSRVDVVFAYRDMKSLRVTRAEQIAQARVARHAVELEDVKRGAMLCVDADINVLRRLPDNSYAMQHGPYHRKFLDGYYPYHVSLTVHYANSGLQLRHVEPGAQEGFYITEKPGILSIDSWFEGELRIGLEFSTR